MKVSHGAVNENQLIGVGNNTDISLVLAWLYVCCGKSSKKHDSVPWYRKFCRKKQSKK